MKVEISEHAKDRMEEYDVSEDLVRDTLRNPDRVAGGLRWQKDISKEIKQLHVKGHNRRT
ncbi:MAG: DUF4258 domain-containing protein [Thaumarchaeota archaeon]|nr:DUF4258 domain-containing protein [Nitrososphaerota archaeon]